MKPLRLIVFAVAALTSMGMSAQKGDWSGKLTVYGNDITLVFHLDDDHCTIDSPDQGAKGIAAKMERTATGVKVSVPSINAVYEGINMGSSIMGTFKQNGQAFPLTLKPGAVKRNRPQTPIAPYPYQTEEVSFTNGNAVLKGTLTKPQGFSRKTPVLLMVTGSGLQNRDEEIYEHKPFAVIADALARQGIATLRYDDRGFGESTGDLTNVTTEDLKNDALAGITLLRKQFDKVGIIGHSEGGTIALMLAAEQKVDFVVSLAGSITSGQNVLLEQNRWTLQQAGYESNVIDRYCEVLDKLFNDVKAGVNPIIDSQGLPTELAKNLEAVKAQCSTPYLRYFLGLDISDSLSKITCPVLALNGTKDRQVACEENLTILRNGLKSKKEILAIEGVNHLFQHCNTGNPDEYKDIEETFAPEALKTIIEWLQGKAVY